VLTAVACTLEDGLEEPGKELPVCEMANELPETLHWNLDRFQIVWNTLVLNDSEMLVFEEDKIIRTSFVYGDPDTVYEYHPDESVGAATKLGEFIWAGLLSEKGTVVLRSSDYFGNEWEAIDTLSGSWFRKLQFVNDSTGFATAFISGSGDRLFYKTYDGGYSWEKLDLLLQPVEMFQLIDEQTGYLINNNYELVKTDDGFETSSVITDPNYYVTSFHFANADVGYASFLERDNKSSGGLLKTTDGGASWRIIHDEINTVIHFASENEGLIRQPNSEPCYLESQDREVNFVRLYETTNGGETWNASPQQGMYSFSWIQRYRDDLIYARMMMNFQTPRLVRLRMNR
jgi:hypothetical protein